jgi:hypothetical protein
MLTRILFWKHSIQLTYKVEFDKKIVIILQQRWYTNKKKERKKERKRKTLTVHTVAPTHSSLKNIQSFSNLCDNSNLPNVKKSSVKKSSVKKLLKVYVFLLLVYQRRGLSMIFPSARLIFVFYDYSYFSYNFHVTDVKIQIMRTIHEIIIW